jgi:hypothetical protein
MSGGWVEQLIGTAAIEGGRRLVIIIFVNTLS